MIFQSIEERKSNDTGTVFQNTASRKVETPSNISQRVH